MKYIVKLVSGRPVVIDAGRIVIENGNLLFFSPRPLVGPIAAVSPGNWVSFEEEAAADTVMPTLTAP